MSVKYADLKSLYDVLPKEVQDTYKGSLEPLKYRDLNQWFKEADFSKVKSLPARVIPILVKDPKLVEIFVHASLGRG